MHPRLAAVVDYLVQARTELLLTVARVPEPLREARPSEEAWSVAEILEHLMIIEKGVTKLVSIKASELRANAAAPREAPEMVGVDVSRFELLSDRNQVIPAPERVVPRGELSAAAVLTTMEETRAALLAQLEQADGLALSGVQHPHPVLGMLDLYEWIYATAGHELRHAAQIREVSDQLAAQ